MVLGGQVGVARAGETRDPVGGGVVAADADHEQVRAREHLDHGALGRNDALRGLEFRQDARVGGGPGRLTHAAIEDELRGEGARSELRSIARLRPEGRSPDSQKRDRRDQD